MRLITLYIPESWLRQLDQLVEAGFYPNRAEAIRASIRDMLRNELKLLPKPSEVKVALTPDFSDDAGFHERRNQLAMQSA